MSMHRGVTPSFRIVRRLRTGLALAAVCLVSSGYSSCAGTTGPLFAPLTITPGEVLLRASLTTRQEAVGLAQVNGPSGDRYRASVEYGKRDSDWLTVEVAGRLLTLRASPAALDPGVYTARVVVDGDRSGASGSFQVELTVVP